MWLSPTERLQFWKQEAVAGGASYHEETARSPWPSHPLGAGLTPCLHHCLGVRGPSHWRRSWPPRGGPWGPVVRTSLSGRGRGKSPRGKAGFQEAVTGSSSLRLAAAPARSAFHFLSFIMHAACGPGRAQCRGGLWDEVRPGTKVPDGVDREPGGLKLLHAAPAAWWSDRS